MQRAFLVVTLALSVAACSREATNATASFQSRSGSQVTGTATFTQTENGVDVVILARSLPEGKHGVYLQENGDCTGSNAAAVGNRFTPGGNEDAAVIGEVEGGDPLKVTKKELTVAAGERSVVGRAIVITSDPHRPELKETFGIIACGVIEAAG